MIFPETGSVINLTYEYYAAPAGQPETTAYLPTGIVQTGGEPMFPHNFPGAIQKLDLSDV